MLEVDGREPHEFGEDEIAFLRTYANMPASAVARLRAEEELRRRAEDNERLLRELQHRVKNNLQVIVGLVGGAGAPCARAPRSAAVLRAVGQRVEALRLLHDKLYVGGVVDRVDLGAYVSRAGGQPAALPRERGRRIRLVLEVERGPPSAGRGGAARAGGE